LGVTQAQDGTVYGLSLAPLTLLHVSVPHQK